MTNLAAIATNYRDIGDTTPAAIAAVLAGTASPMAATAASTAAAASPVSAQFWAQAGFENRFQTTGTVLKPEDHNPVALRPWIHDPDGHQAPVIGWRHRQPLDSTVLVSPHAIGAVRDRGGAYMLRFASDAECAKEYRRRLLDPAYKAGVYATAKTLHECLAIYCPPGDIHPESGIDNSAILGNYEATVIRILRELAAKEDPATGQRSDNLSDGNQITDTKGETPMPETITFGRVPHPGYIDFQDRMAGKPEGVGWDNLGKRTPRFIVLHRMWGSLTGTDQFFAMPSTGALTDYGMGVEATDGKDLAGVIHKYNDPLGYRAGWASGRVSNPYGDGKCIVDTYGINAVNRDGVSIETSGYSDTPVDDFAWGELVKLCAYWIDVMEIPYSTLPLNPHTGCNAMVWHQEFTIGTGKKCPFTWLMDHTDQLYTDVAAYLKPLQTSVQGKPEPTPEPPPEETPQYADPVPIPELALVADQNADKVAAIQTREADQFIFVGDIVEAVRQTPRLQLAYSGADRVGPDIEKGEQFQVDFTVRAKDGQWYYVTPYWTRVLVDDTKRVKDAA